MEKKKGPEYIVRRRGGKRQDLEPLPSPSIPQLEESSESSSKDTNSKIQPCIQTPKLFPLRSISSVKRPDCVYTEPPALQNRHWIGNASSLRMVSYDILSDDRIRSEIWSYPHPSLDLLSRSVLISKELQQLRPNIVCLQDVDQNFQSYFSALPHFESLSSINSESQEKTGVAVMFDVRKLELVFSAKVNYRVAEISALGNEHTGLIALVQIRGTRKAVLVANTRLSYTDHMCHLGELLILLKAVLATAEHFESEFDLGILIAGNFDFNPCSALYYYMKQGTLPLSHISPTDFACRYSCDTQQFGNREDIKEVILRGYTPKTASEQPVCLEQIQELAEIGVELRKERGTRFVALRQPSNGPMTCLKGLLSVKSAYEELTESEPFPTTQTRTVFGTTDYIWYAGKIMVSGVLQTPPLSDFLQHSGVPNQYFPSDHISLAIDFDMP